MLQILVNTDSNVRGGPDLDASVDALVGSPLRRFAGRLTRVSVHLSDLNGLKTRGRDKRCVIEARPANGRPVTVSHVGLTFSEALVGARRKMLRHLDDAFDRVKSIRRRPADRSRAGTRAPE
jgi:hypothetical protein